MRYDGAEGFAGLDTLWGIGIGFDIAAINAPEGAVEVDLECGGRRGAED